MLMACKLLQRVSLRSGFATAQQPADLRLDEQVERDAGEARDAQESLHAVRDTVGERRLQSGCDVVEGHPREIPFTETRLPESQVDVVLVRVVRPGLRGLGCERLLRIVAEQT